MYKQNIASVLDNTDSRDESKFLKIIFRYLENEKGKSE